VNEERRARAPSRILGPTLFRDVDKLSVTFVQIHLIRTEIRKIQVRQAVVVYVADRNAHSISGSDDAALVGYISEPKRAAAVFVDCQIVAEESASRRLCCAPGE